MNENSHPTSRRRAARRICGFNLMEVTVVLSIAMTASAVGGPPLAGFLHRSKIEGTAYEVSSLLRACRAIAVSRGSNTIVHLDEGTQEIVAFADVHGNSLQEPGDGIFNPLTGLPPRLTDYEIARIALPAGVRFVAPDGTEGADSVDGFLNPSPMPQDRAIFLEDGTVQSAGAFRVADGRGNYFEVVLVNEAARIELRKWEDDAYWLPRGDEGSWSWN